MAYQYDGLGVHQILNLAAQRHQRIRSIVQGIFCGFHMWTANSDRRQKGVGGAIRVCSTQSRSKFLVMTKILGQLDATETLTTRAASFQQVRRDYVDLPWSTFQETEPTPTSAEVQRAVTRCGWHRSPSTSKAMRSCSKKHSCSQHIDDILQAATVRSLLDPVSIRCQAVCHTGPQDVDDVMKGVPSQRSAGGSDKWHS